MFIENLSFTLKSIEIDHILYKNLNSYVRIIENLIPLHCKSLNFHAILLFLHDLNPINSKTMMLITKYQYFIGLTLSKKTSLMSTAKCLRTHIWQINWQILAPLVLASSGQEWQYDISTVRAHIGRSNGRSVRFILLELIIGRSTGRSTPW